MSNFTGKIFLIIGPSGVGKGTYIANLKAKYPQWTFPVSVTTRTKRPHEIAGKSYHFYSKKRFNQELLEGKFLEWACVHGDQYYGLLKKTIIDALKKGEIIIREIDIQGYESARKIIPAENLVSIFLLPPNLQVLIKRIKARSPLSDEEVLKRMQSAEKEISKADECDYQLRTIDNKIELTTARLEKIILQEINLNIE